MDPSGLRGHPILFSNQQFAYAVPNAEVSHLEVNR